MSTDVNATYRTSFAVRDSTGTLVDPSTVTVTVTLPDQSTATPATTHDSTGNYHLDYVMTQEGLHRFTWAATSPTVSQTDYENAVVFRSVIGLAEARDFLNVLDTSRDPLLRGIMAAATELAEHIVGTCVIRTFTDEHIPGTTRAAIRLPHGPLPTVNAVTSISSEWPSGPTWQGTDLMVYRDSGVVEPKNYFGFWWGPWKATYQAGRTVVPQRILLAVKEIIFDLWATQRMVSADMMTPSLEETAAYETAMPSNYQIPPHARALLNAEAMPGFA
jgi:hypothetical protein